MIGNIFCPPPNAENVGDCRLSRAIGRRPPPFPDAAAAAAFKTRRLRHRWRRYNWLIAGAAHLSRINSVAVRRSCAPSFSCWRNFIRVAGMRSDRCGFRRRWYDDTMYERERILATLGARGGGCLPVSEELATWNISTGFPSTLN